jgi:thiamine biosynthesis lipoprotein
MKQETRLLMGMPITVAIAAPAATQADLDTVFAAFVAVDDTFSTYKPESEMSRINRGELAVERASAAMRTVLALAAQTKRETYGYFDIERDGLRDPSGIVKGWAVYNAAAILKARGWRDFYIDAGGDIQVCGANHGKLWRVGVRNPFNRDECVKVLCLGECGVATSGTVIRGQHIYNPHHPGAPIEDVVSLTVVGPNVYEADRFATAAFAMGASGLRFIEDLPGFEGYQIAADARATYTSGFERYVLRP